MIWSRGKLVADDALTISVLDRSLEHGLGLFETFRTWNGRARLLGKHLGRLKRSAEALGIPLDGVTLPDADAVSVLIDADGTEGDRMLRITLSGGVSETGGGTLWMRSFPLPEPIKHDGAIVALGSWRVDFADGLARHKTLNYWSRRRAFESARALHYHEILSMTRDGRVWEGSRSNLFLVRKSRLFTPTLDGPIVPGVMRALVLEQAVGLPWSVIPTDTITRSFLSGADEVFLTNSVRGLIPVSRVGDFRYEPCGEWVRRLTILVSDYLSGGGEDAEEEKP